MNERKNFTRKSFLQRFVISQVLLIAVMFVIIAVAGQHAVRGARMDNEKVASKLISVKTAGTTAQK